MDFRWFLLAVLFVTASLLYLQSRESYSPPVGAAFNDSLENYSAENIYADLLFFRERVNSQERELFLQNYRKIGDAILDACPLYFPDVPLKNCARIFIAVALKESTFNQFEAHELSAEFPTLGLLQIRKSSTVRDMNRYGNTAPLVERGIFFQDPTNEQLMDISYSVHLGMWYISLHARSNARYARQYCVEEGETGNIVVGLSSHRIGPTAVQQGTDLHLAVEYVDKIKADYLKLFEKDRETPQVDYFAQRLPRLESLCR